MPSIYAVQDKSNFRTIKVPLKKVLNVDNHPDISQSIEFLVTEMNNLATHSYQFIRLYILFLYDNDLEAIQFIDQKLISYAVKTLCDSPYTRESVFIDRDLRTRLSDFYELEYKPLFDHNKTNSLFKGYIIDHLVTQIYTDITNNIQERFVTHHLPR